jgi:hypothetical protein
LLKTANYIDGIPFASLQEVRKWKESSGRPKDIKDLDLIDKYLASNKRQTIITICSSASFYKQAVNIQEQLQDNGYKVLIPLTAEDMKTTGDFDVSHYKTWFGNEDDYYKKTVLIRDHFNMIEKGDVILVLNYEKHGMPNYIGGNVLMEMAIAFYLKKPIYILNEIPDKSPFIEEIQGLNPLVLHGKLEDLQINF